MKSSAFRRHTLALFFIVSLIPALTVASIWYLNTQLNGGDVVELDVNHFILPVFILGIIPALALSVIFAELISRPVRRIHMAALELAKGNYGTHFSSEGVGEFDEIAVALDQVASQLQRTLSEAASETEVIGAERNKLRSVLNSMSDGVFAMDRSGRIILFNKAASEITGRTIEEVAGQLAEKVMPFRADGELVMTRWLATQHGADRKIGQWRGLELYRADGASLYVDVEAVVLTDDPNGINALVTFHDLTKSHQLEEMKVDFVALAAHELRTPLTEIRGFIDILQHESKLKSADRVLLDRAMVSAQTLSMLVNNLLNVSRIEHGELNFRPEIIDYHRFLKDFAMEVKDRFKDQQKEFALDIPRSLPPVNVDASALHEVLANLVDNALAHTTVGKAKVIVSVTQTNGELETHVIDNGEGMAKAGMSRLFTKFYRINEFKSTTRGTGLGLYICKSIIEAHGGHIWAESVEGKGSTFGFRLPIAKVASGSAAHDNKKVITRGAHGWIKDHSIHRG